MTLLLDEMAATAIAKHSHYYTSVAGWLLRADARRWSIVVDADREEYGVTAPEIVLRAYPVIRWTPCGATILDIWGRACRTRFCDLRDGVKQYASRTPQEAVYQLGERRRRQIWVLSCKVDRAHEDRELVRQTLCQLTAELPNEETTT